ncbi:hypothetical protein B0T25DRAFT_529304 [Lasiosphaeria hispida]|uniref:Uncharacterized protein n=1 Tax=Lasiosphaeria hispida TaxID=260671 RepID=A0AAJ0MKU1_9PEZI|nr:hypothetical protein B0T25DRAFT_529304 [Lasiosphaeria hispida]
MTKFVVVAVVALTEFGVVVALTFLLDVVTLTFLLVAVVEREEKIMWTNFFLAAILSPRAAIPGSALHVVVVSHCDW